MSDVIVRSIFEAKCNRCGQIKTSSNEALVRGWADNHSCDGPVYTAFEFRGSSGEHLGVVDL